MIHARGLCHDASQKAMQVITSFVDAYSADAFDVPDVCAAGALPRVVCLSDSRGDPASSNTSQRLLPRASAGEKRLRSAITSRAKGPQRSHVSLKCTYMHNYIRNYRISLGSKECLCKYCEVNGCKMKPRFLTALLGLLWICSKGEFGIGLN